MHKKVDLLPELELGAVEDIELTLRSIQAGRTFEEQIDAESEQGSATLERAKRISQEVAYLGLKAIDGFFSTLNRIVPGSTQDV